MFCEIVDARIFANSVEQNAVHGGRASGVFYVDVLERAPLVPVGHERWIDQDIVVIGDGLWNVMGPSRPSVESDNTYLFPSSIRLR